MNPDTSLLRLLQLCSATLPVGAYAFSQGLEYAIDQHWLKDEAAIKEWLSILLVHSLAKTDAPVLLRIMRAIENADKQTVVDWNNCLLACRETNELRLTDVAMGTALKRLLVQLDMEEEFFPLHESTFAVGFAIAAVQWNIRSDDAINGYLWSWLENQIAAATKLLPMGQTQAQRMLFELSNNIPYATNIALTLEDNKIGTSMPGLACASSWHETQYSRLYRS